MPTVESGSLAEALIEYVRADQDDYIESNPGSGEYAIKELRLFPNREIVVTYDEDAEA